MLVLKRLELRAMLIAQLDFEARYCRTQQVIDITVQRHVRRKRNEVAWRAGHWEARDDGCRAIPRCVVRTVRDPGERHSELGDLVDGCCPGGDVRRGFGVSEKSGEGTRYASLRKC